MPPSEICSLSWWVPASDYRDFCSLLLRSDNLTEVSFGHYLSQLWDQGSSSSSSDTDINLFQRTVFKSLARIKVCIIALQHTASAVWPYENMVEALDTLVCL